MNFPRLIPNKFADRITRRLQKSQAESEPAPEKTTAPKEFDVMPLVQGSPFEVPRVFGGHYNIVRDAWKMYNQDDRVRSDIDAIAEDATQNNRDNLPFTIDVNHVLGEHENEAEEIQKRFHDKFDSLKIYQRCTEMIKWILIEGTRFYRLIVDFDKNESVELRHIKGPKSGFITIKLDEGVYKGYYVQFEYFSQRPVAIMAPWEVVRFDWNRPDEDSYGLGLFSSARKNWKRLDSTEDDLYIARKTRAYMRLSRQFPGMSADQLLKIKQAEEMDRKKHGNADVTTDIYTTGKVEPIQGSNTAFSNINDVEYSQRKLMASGRRPVALMGGYGKEAANRAVLDRQEHRFVVGFLSSVREMYSNGIKKVFDVNLPLWGYLPGDWKITLNWTRLSIEDKRILGTIAKDAVENMALPPIQTYAQLFDLDPETVKEEIERELEWRAEIEERHGIPSVDEGFKPNANV